jgi:hypothetical protein
MSGWEKLKLTKTTNHRAGVDADEVRASRAAVITIVQLMVKVNSNRLTLHHRLLRLDAVDLQTLVVEAIASMDFRMRPSIDKALRQPRWDKHQMPADRLPGYYPGHRMLLLEEGARVVLQYHINLDNKDYTSLDPKATSPERIQWCR